MSAGDSRRAPFRADKSGISYGTDDGEKQANPSAVIGKFEETGGTGERFTDKLPEMEIPGFGELGDDCGDDIPRFCADCGHTQSVGRTCYGWECPRCWKGADRKRSATATAKLEALRRYKETSEGPGWRGYKFHHLTLSPPEGFALDSEEPLDRTFDLLKEVLAELGAETGMLVYHPFRGEDGDDRGFWKNVLPDGEPQDWEPTRDDLTHSPHFHAVVLAKHIDGGHVTKALEEQTGWVIERITKGDDSNVSIYDLHDLARVVTYCLSHAGVIDGSNQYRYYGELHNFGANPNIERQADAAVRAVATNTLGLAYDSVACTTEREQTITKLIEVREEKVSMGAAHGSGEPELVEKEIEETVVDDCEGRMMDIKNAPAFLTDDDWTEHAENVEQLRSAWRDWRGKIDEEPDERPPDTDTGD